MNSPSTRRRRGFTLIEVILAMLVIGIGLLAMVTAATRCLSVVRGARFFEDARHLMAVLEVDVPVVPDEVEEGTEDGQFDEPYEAYRWERDIRPAGEDEEYRLFVVVTRIIRVSEGSRPSVEEVATLLYAPEEDEP